MALIIIDIPKIEETLRKIYFKRNMFREIRRHVVHKAIMICDNSVNKSFVSRRQISLIMTIYQLGMHCLLIRMMYLAKMPIRY